MQIVGKTAGAPLKLYSFPHKKRPSEDERFSIIYQNLSAFSLMPGPMVLEITAERI